MLRIFAAIFVVMLSICAANAQVEETIGSIIESLGKKCGPQSGKTPNSMAEEQRHQCEEYATKANKLLGLRGPGFGLSAEGARKINGLKQVVYLGSEAPCNMSAHTTYEAWGGYVTLKEAQRGIACTKTIPYSVPVRSLTCGLYDSGAGSAFCRNNGDTGDCPYAATVAIYSLYSSHGRQYCWWVYNQADRERQFSIAIQ